ncbi:MAG: HD-GYP domain-containing protein [Lachnospiraceae bacterium]|nr:HD-GYP domain-containing protein [Lachnospiraceae bacterium]MDE6251744.1 HD-GYP domain-containing protein [Lachnospiraceae bacterium]
MKIKKLLTAQAKPGMVIANDIYDESGMLIIPKETILDKSIIMKMEKYSVFILKVFQEDEDVQKESEGFYEKLTSSEEFEQFGEEFGKSTNRLRNEFNQIVSKKATNLDQDKMLDVVNRIIDSNKNNYHMLDMLNCMRGYDDLTYIHCINVALICNMMAEWLGYSKEKTDELTMAGLLHDIGKVKIPKDIITKPGKLNDDEYEVVKYHPKLSYEILRETNLSEGVKKAVLMHHERYDGSGYPFKLKGNDISETARIVAIADVYDAMTANRVYRKGICPFEVIEYFQNQISVYDPQFLLEFLEHTAQTYVGNKVQLSNGEVGKVAMINKQDIGRPVVLVGDKALNLSIQTDIKVKKMM